MICRDVMPIPALASLVRYHSIIHFQFSRSDQLPVKPYPAKAEHCLCFYPRDLEVVEHFETGKSQPRFRSCIIGQQTRRTNRHISYDFIIIQIHFQPGALFLLTGIPQHELIDTFIDAESIWGRPVRELNEQLAETNNYGQMIRSIEQFLMYLFNRTQQSIHAVDRLHSKLMSFPTQFHLDQLADQACLSNRQLQRLFLERVGVSPKLVSRMARFEMALKMRDIRADWDWLSIALQCGYYDYNHMVRDFREFAGISPPAYWQQEVKAPERLVLGLNRTMIQSDLL
jgi:AraC-like DNA-binding protein